MKNIFTSFQYIFITKIFRNSIYLILLTFIFSLFTINSYSQVCFNPITNYAAGAEPSSITSADFNGDSKADLVVVNRNSNNISVLLGNGTGSFGAATNFTTGTNPQSVTSADFNGDGKADLAVANYTSNNVSVLLGNGTGSFSAATNFTAGTTPFSITSADFNGDGIVDLAVTNMNSDNVSILLGTGTGSFGVANNFAVGDGPVSIISKDFNGDSKADLAVVNINSYNVSILLGIGTGNFGIATNFSVNSTNPRSVTSADFNGDGKIDLAVTNSSNVSILLGNGTGSFSAPTDFGANSAPCSVISMDFNSDGKADLAVTNFGSNDISVLFGTGTGSFGAVINFVVGYNPYYITSADFNGDTKADLASANSGSSNVSVLINSVPPTVNAGVDQTICSNNSATLSGNIIGTPGGVWSGGTGTFAPNSNTLNAVYTPSATEITAGTVTLTLTSTSCNSVSDQMNITIKTPNATISTNTNVSCNGGSNGSATASVSGGTPGYTYLWNDPAPAQTTPTCTALTAGTWTVTVTDAIGCTSTSSVIITQPSALIATISAQTNVSCSGGSDGSATVSASGGTPGYTYLWNDPAPAQTTTTCTALTAGTWTVTVSDSYGCTATTSVTITEPVITVSNTGPYCTDNTIQLNVSAATSYSWSGPFGFTSSLQNPTISVATPAMAGVYSVTVTYAAGCTANSTTMVIVNSAPTVNAGVDQVVCEGTAVTLSGSGATSYIWDNGVINGIPFTPAFGTVTYTVTGTTGGCSNTDQVVVTVNSLNTPSISINASSSIICTGTLVTFNATPTNGGTTPIYQWKLNGSNVGTNSTTYTNGTLANGNTIQCVMTTSTVCPTTPTANSNTITMSVNPAPTVNAGNDTTICVGGFAILGATGASSYAWNTGAIIDTIMVNPLSTTTYTVTGTDANGCSNTDIVIVTVDNIPTVDAGPDQVICSGNQVTLSGSGATSFIWNNGVLNGVPFTPTGTLTYTVTGTTGGCSNTDQVIVTVNPSPIATISGITSICSGGNTTLTASGGGTYVWNIAANTPDIIVSPITTTTYTVTVTMMGCSSTASTTVTVNDIPTVNAGNDVIVCNVEDSTTLTAIAFGGTSPYTYTWDFGIINGIPFQFLNSTLCTVIGMDANGCTNTDQVLVTVSSSITPVITGSTTFCTGGYAILDAGSGYNSYLWSTGATSQTITVNTDGVYSVTVTNSIGCTGTDSVTVTESSILTPTITGLSSFCSNNATTLDAGSGYNSYSWSNGATSQTITVFTANTYSVTVSNGSGCYGEDSITVTVNPLPTVSAGNNVSICNGGSTTLVATGASSYIWSPSVGLSSTTDSIITANPTSTIIYYVTGTDANGCTNTDNVVVTITSGLSPLITGSTTFCTGSSTTLNAGTYATYLWSSGETIMTISVNTPGTYSVTVSDGNGCTGTASVNISESSGLTPTITGNNICSGSSTLLDVGMGYNSYLWSTGANSQSISVSTGGTYYVTVTDVSGCTGSGQITISEYPLPTVYAGSDITICTGDSTLLIATGASTYFWAPPNGLSSTTGGSVTATPTATSTYYVTGTDLNGCSNTDNVVVTVSSSLNPTITGSTTICPGGSVMLNAGSGYSSYLWSNSSILPVITVNTIGVYFVTVTNASGCTGSDSIIITPGSNLTPTIIGNNFCAGSNTTLNAGVGYITYLWNTGATSQTIIVSIANTYIVTVTDMSGCSGTGQITISEYPSPNVFAGNNITICAGNSTVLNATGAFTYAWAPPNGLSSTSGSSVTANPTSTTTYYVTGTDMNGCTNTDNVVVTVASSLNPTIMGSTAICTGEPTTLSVTGSYSSYLWSNSANTNSITVNISGNYSVTVTNYSGCTGTAQITISDSPKPFASFMVQNSCVGQNTVFTNTSTIVSPDFFIWNFGDGYISTEFSTNHIYENTGGYSVYLVAFSQNGCRDTSDIVNVYINPTPDIFITSQNNDTILNNGGEQIMLFGNGAGAYLWSNGSQNQSIQVNNGGIYWVIGTTPNGCQGTDSITIYQNNNYNNDESSIILASSILTPNGDGINECLTISNLQDYWCCNIEIYDIWNRKVFWTDHCYNNNWDCRLNGNGNILPDGAYYYIINCGMETKKGNINILTNNR